jgi:hypothetical protein
MSRIVQTWSGPRETDYPADAICDEEFCGHAFEAHSFGANCGVCNACDHPVTLASPGLNFHYFKPRRLTAGTFSPSAEHEAYERAMRGDA